MNLRRSVDYAFTGQLVNRFETTHYDPHTKLFYKRTTEYIDVGRPDPINPSRGDELLGEEPRATHQQVAAAHEARRQQSLDNHAAIQAALIAYIAEHGPTSSADLAAGTGLKEGAIRPHLSQRSGTVYVRLYGTDRRIKVWGIFGVHDKQEGI